MGEVVFLHQIIVGVFHPAGVPDAVGLVLAERAMIAEQKDDAAVEAEFSPACLRIVKVVGEVAVLDGPMAAVFDFQSDVPALGIDVPERHVRDAVSRDAHAFEVLRIALTGADHPCPATVDRNVRCLDDDRPVGLRRIEDGVLGDFQWPRTGGSRRLGLRDGHCCHHNA